MDNNEKIGFHKGALDCLLKERSEFSRILSIVDALIQMHTKALSDAGIDIKAELEKARQAAGQNQQQQAGGQQQADENFVNIDSAIQDSKKNF
ncbi:MAG: hypothetical protein KAS11_04275 [Candidatus Aenigmarchaeota archaeon]|nr:hypothetical protein [Candidatus Aenigmarchaeota archaeon]